MAWIIRPLPEFAEVFKQQTQTDHLRLATFPPNWTFEDGIMRWIIGAGNILDETLGLVFSFDVQQVTIIPEAIRQADLILWPGIDDVQKPDLSEFYPEFESADGSVSNSVQQPQMDTPVRKLSNRPAPRPAKPTGQASYGNGQADRVRKHLDENPDDLNKSPRTLGKELGVGKSTVNNVQSKMKRELLDASNGQPI